MYTVYVRTRIQAIVCCERENTVFWQDDASLFLPFLRHVHIGKHRCELSQSLSNFKKFFWTPWTKTAPLDWARDCRQQTRSYPILLYTICPKKKISSGWRRRSRFLLVIVIYDDWFSYQSLSSRSWRMMEDCGKGIFRSRVVSVMRM